MAFFQSRLFLRIVSAHRQVYVLKILTLGIAFASSTLIALFSLHEFGYDRFHTEANCVFRVIQRNEGERAHGNRLSNRIPPKVFHSLKYAPDSLVVSRIKILNRVTVLPSTDEVKVHAVDPSIVDIFSFTAVAGSFDAFKKNKRSAILSQSAAARYFGTTPAVGQSLKLPGVSDTVAWVVAAVFENYPQNVHEQFDVLLRYEDDGIRRLGFDPAESGVYGKLRKGSLANHEVIVNELTKDTGYRYILQPVPDIYFGPAVLGEDARHGDFYSVIILICITALILCLALTSFINLTALTLPHRSKEIAIKKLAGNNQWNVLLTFIRESFTVTGISLVLGLLLLVASAQFIEPILSIRLFPLLFQRDFTVSIILTGLLLVTSVAPLFLAVRFAQATPNRLLRADTITFPRFKRIITVVQLGIGLFLIVASMVIRRQVNYSLIKEPGRNHYQIVYLTYPKGLTEDGLRYLQSNWRQGRSNPNIDGVIATSQLPGGITSKELNSGLYTMSVDPDFPDFFDLKLLSGRWFSPNDSDSALLVNAQGYRSLQGNTRNVIGTLEDPAGLFNQPERPVKFTLTRYFNYNFLCVRVLEVNIRNTVGFLSREFGTFDAPARVSFLNERFEQWLDYQDKLNILSGILTVISGVLACCAIYGLSVSLVRDKLKQIAIHRLCGASVVNITGILIRDFARQLLVAAIIFGPFTYIFLHEWLRNFVYTTPFNWLDPLIPLLYSAVVIGALCALQAYSVNRKDLSSSLHA